MSRVRYAFDGGSTVISSTLVDLYEDLNVSESSRRDCAAAIFSGGVYKGSFNGRTFWAWECPKFEYVCYDKYGEPDMDFDYADGPFADGFSGEEPTSEPEFVRNIIRGRLNAHAIAAE